MNNKKTKRTQKPKDYKPSSGRPTKYKAEYNDQVYRLCLLGATDKEIADFFNVNEDTVHEWKKVYSEFSESIAKGKIYADAYVAESLYKRATGCTIRERQFEGEKIIREIEKELAPDTAAASRWLGNRRRKLWGDKLDINSTNTNINTIPLTPDEIKDISKQLENEY